jgi:catechol 2,3-dioxygenase-like lactoylglutathione lyase family enzyme
VSTDLWLVGFQSFDEETDAHFVCAQQVEQPQTRPVSQRPEEHFLVKTLCFLAHAANLTTILHIRLDIYSALAHTAEHIRIGECEKDRQIAKELRKMSSETKVQALKAHLALNVRDVERSIEFYGKMLGIEPSKVRTGYAKFDVQNPPLNLTLNQHSFADSGALSHLGIQVASTKDVFAIREKWIEAGLVTRDELQTACCYALQDKTWVRDPDGNEWEVFVVLEDNLAETAACECGTKVAEGEKQTEAVSCCGTTTVGVTRQAAAAEATCS